jgi:hypothetical protein
MDEEQNSMPLFSNRSKGENLPSILPAIQTQKKIAPQIIKDLDFEATNNVSDAGRH